LGAMLMIEDISAEKRMKSTMSRYMDPALADRLMGAEGGEDLLGGKSAEATVLFSDIRGFTALTEKLGAQATVLLLNDYFTIMVECLAKEGGMLDKFIGDAIMAAFGLPLPLGDDADRALRAAIAMLTSLEEWNAKRRNLGESPWEMGIGINTDLVVSGNIGSPKRMDYTLIGDGVNLAARLESACTIYSARLLISEFTREKLKGAYRIRHIDDVVVKGKTEPVAVHEVLDSHSAAAFPNLMDVINNFNEARMRYKSGDFEKSIRSFKQCLKAHPGDNLSKTYIERCQRLMADTPKDWDGVWVLTVK
ncbi:MAG TPA: adenylate/guanylate cyclase domain-containing protein, partial [Rhodospirillales bacterium]|nr:adenylate/guanylate cyclase domain-containing protein [Rhodospirillales bacterium]